MVSLWWSFTLTVIGVTGLVLVYARKNSMIGPAIGLSVQVLWLAYALSTEQWWFLVSAFTYGAANTYGLHQRRKATTDG